MCSVAVISSWILERGVFCETQLIPEQTERELQQGQAGAARVIAVIAKILCILPENIVAYL